MELASKVRTCLMFAKGGQTAADFYVSLIPDSRIDAVLPHGNPDDPMVVEFTLAGCPMMILTAGPMHELTPAVSISVLTEDQAETDELWTKLLAQGGSELACGWVKDRFGVCWQIIPKVLPRLLSDPDAEKAARAMDAMKQMIKIDISALEAAAAG